MIDIKRRWKITRSKYKDRHLNGKISTSKVGISYKQYDYNVGLQKKIIEEVVTTLRKHGLNYKSIINQWSKRTGILKTDAEQYIKGDRLGMPLWVLEHLLKTFQFEVKIIYKGERSYSHSVENDRLIIVCNQNPPFVININMDDFYDINVDFFNSNLRLSCTAVTKMIFEGLQYYFLSEGKKDKFPFVKSKMLERLTQMYHNGEFNIKKRAYL